MTNYNRNLASAFASTVPLSLKHPEHAIMSVFEHQRLMATDFARKSDFEWLLAQEFAVFTIRRLRGQWQLQVGHYIGVIILPSGITLEILPKAVAGAQKTSALQRQEILRARQWVQLMCSDLQALSIANKQKMPHSQNFGQLSQYLSPIAAQAVPLSQWLAAQFLQLLSHYQPSQQYETQTCNQVALQGKLLIKEQLLRNHHQPYKFACEISQLSQETLPNRIIKSALIFIEQLAVSYQQPNLAANPLSPALRGLLAPWQSVIGLSPTERQNLTSLYPQAKQQLGIQPISLQKRHAAQQLLDLAYWLLQMQQSSIPTGNMASQQGSRWQLCLLINMHQAFEQWASWRIGSLFTQIGSDYKAFYQSQRVWLSDRSGQTQLSIRPDLLITHTFEHEGDSHNPRYSHVIDIKWKHLAHPHDISASDAYQLTSYAQAYQAEQVWLVYPVTDDTRKPVALRQSALASPSLPSKQAKHATLWLMPFNVTTGALTSWPE